MESLAARIAARSFFTGMIAATGPNNSSSYAAMRFLTSVSTVGG
jgi:hypothetical protein